MATGLRLDCAQPVGVVIVGVFGNNGSTLAALLTRRNAREANDDMPGSVASMCSVLDIDAKQHNVRDLLTSIEALPSYIPFIGYDLDFPEQVKTIGEAITRNNVIPNDVQTEIRVQRYPQLFDEGHVLPGFEAPDWIQPHQTEVPNGDEKEYQEKSSFCFDFAEEIDKFATKNKLGHVIVLYCGNTEKNIADPRLEDYQSFYDELKNGDADNIISPSMVYAAGCLFSETKCSFINTAAQKTNCNGLLEWFQKKERNYIGNDLSSGQTKFATSMLDLFMCSGIAPDTVTSINFLGNNDGHNLKRSSEQNKAKIKSKSSMTSAMEVRNPLMYERQGKTIDRLVTIDYVKRYGDNKRALDDFTSSLLFGGQYDVSVRNICPDTLLAVPIMFDLVIFTALLDRVYVRDADKPTRKLSHSQMNEFLSVFLKDPSIDKLTFAFFRERFQLLTGFVVTLAGKQAMTSEFVSVLKN